MTPNNDFERTLNEALGQYRNAEPLSGIEERVLARLRLAEESHTPLKRWNALAATIALLVVASLAGAYLFNRGSRSVISRQATALPQAKQATAVTRENPVAPLRRMEPKQNRAVHHESLANDAELGPPRPRRAPIQAPLSLQERTLIALGQANPEVFEDATRDGTQIAISPINIRPIQMDTLNTGEN